MPTQLRDQHGASRSVAFLMLFGAPFLFFTGVVFVPDGRSVANRAVLGVVTVFLATGGLVSLKRPQWLPQAFWHVASYIAVAIVAALNIATDDPSSGAQLFFLWPVLYAANFLRHRAIVATMLMVSVGDGINLFRLLPFGAAVSDWSSLTVAMSVTSFMVASLGARNDRLREVLESHAYTDPLTGVANRRSFDVSLEQTVEWSHRTGHPIALITMDIDHFKSINDTWGHAVGDKALQRVARCLKRVAESDDSADIVARLGGDEFVILLRAGGRQAQQIADQVREAVAAVTELPGGPPGLSIGIAAVPDHANTASELVAASDAALYEAKSAGRGRTGTAPRRHNVDRLPPAGDASRLTPL